MDLAVKLRKELRNRLLPDEEHQLGEGRQRDERIQRKQRPSDGQMYAEAA